MALLAIHPEVCPAEDPELDPQRKSDWPEHLPEVSPDTPLLLSYLGTLSHWEEY